ncbi:T9SS-dependent choice-of-anchor J family protein [Flavobacterium silvaticum]|uniref:T9SS type A sorting domain-containing protein n=1 Tax=Flavobacterium silvaticum TaxID=1852020 RepID=A0A972FY97_9FLAO|nr:choice-of-anchor J domain-containing protein [Flavobacterium silvaticum]NMH27051.1 T9SS type A sorting domain-containing protein [Flavobacterium silvaticum]
MKKTILSALLAMASFGANAQFTQNFDASASMPAGWSIINQGSPNGWTVSDEVEGGAHSGNNAAAIEYDSTVAHNDYLITPHIAVTATSNRFSFWIKSASEYYLEPYEVRLSTTNTTAAAFTVVLQPSQEASEVWTKKQFDLSNYVGQSVYIAIRATGTNEYILYVDDAVNDAFPSCPASTNVAVGTVTPENAQLTWTSSATAWQYYVGSESDSAPDESDINDAPTNPFTLENLDPATTYKVWVRSSCSGSVGDWSDPIVFTTPCVATPLPTVTEGAETTDEGELPVCWSSTLVSGDNNWEVTTPLFGDITTTASGDKIIYKNYQNSEALLFSPAMDYANVTQPTRVNLYLHRHEFADVADKYVIYANTTPSLTGATQLYEQFSKITSTPAVAATGFYNYKIDIPASFNGASQVFIIIRGITTAGFSSYALGVDDFKVEFTPTCAEVASLTVSDVEAHQATFNWQASASAPANGYEYVWSTSATSPDSAQYSGTTAAGELTATVYELSANTTYYVWVRSVCSATDSSPWTNVVSFTTACDAITESALPWSEGFEDLTDVGDEYFPGCWFKENGDWASSNNDNSDNDEDAHSGNNFLTNSWTADNEYIWTPGFELTAGSNYDFSFWFNSYGDYDSWDASVVVNSAQTSNGATQVGSPFLSVGTTAPDVYTQATRSFVPQTSGVYYFGIKVNEATGDPWYLSFDDFELKSVPLSAEDFQNQQLAFYPNPVKNNLNLSFNETITDVVVVNMLGQQVLNQKINATQATLDMSALTAGTYFVKVNGTNAQKTVKVIKQ